LHGEESYFYQKVVVVVEEEEEEMFLHQGSRDASQNLMVYILLT
jgi:hypothetical protein